MIQRFGSIATLAFALVLGLPIPGCGRGSTSDSNLTLVSTAEAEKLLQGKRNLLGMGGERNGRWVDPRPEADYRAGHIPGAINLPYERVTLEHRKLREYDLLIVYGSDYNDTRAKAMSKRLIELGHKNVHTLLGGLRAWQADDNPIEISTP